MKTIKFFSVLFFSTLLTSTAALAKEANSDSQTAYQYRVVNSTSHHIKNLEIRFTDSTGETTGLYLDNVPANTTGAYVSDYRTPQEMSMFKYEDHYSYVHKCKHPGLENNDTQITITVLTNKGETKFYGEQTGKTYFDEVCVGASS